MQSLLQMCSFNTLCVCMDYQNLLLVIVTLVLLVIFGNLLCKLMVLSLNFQLAFTPKLMGKTERVHQTIEQVLRCLLKG